MILILGSCRVSITMNHSNYMCLNTWQELRKRNLNPKFIIGRSWSANELYEMLRLILGHKHESAYVGHEYLFDSIRSNLQIIRENFANFVDCIVMEVSSLKYYVTADGKIVHNVVHEKLRPEWKEKVLSEAEMDYYLNKITELVPNKKIIFVNHFLHTRVPNRLLINKCLEKVQSRKPEQVRVVTPSNLWSIATEKDWLVDPQHYHHHILIKMARWFDNHIKEHLHL